MGETLEHDIRQWIPGDRSQPMVSREPETSRRFVEQEIMLPGGEKLVLDHPAPRCRQSQRGDLDRFRSGTDDTQESSTREILDSHCMPPCRPVL